MIYVTGDTHGDFKKIVDFSTISESIKEDVLVILGDVGLNYYNSYSELQVKDSIEKLPLTLLCIHGNHEQRPETIVGYKECQWNGGIVYIQEQFPSILFAKCGEIYDLEGKKCLVIGGAYSVDKSLRLANNWSWFSDEQPSIEIKSRVLQKLDLVDWKVDIVLSHTCPFNYIPRETFSSFVDQSSVDDSTERWLGSIEKKLDYDKWYCGHFHIEKTIDKMRFMFDDFLVLN